MNIQQSAGEVCIPNINMAERRKRLLFGILTFSLSLVILAALLVSGTDRLWRLPLLLLFWGAGSSFFQWRDETCVGFARQGVRKIGSTTEKIEDAAELAQVRRQAQQVQLKGLLAALPLTLVALALPSLG